MLQHSCVRSRRSRGKRGAATPARPRLLRLPWRLRWIGCSVWIVLLVLCTEMQLQTGVPACKQTGSRDCLQQSESDSASSFSWPHLRNCCAIDIPRCPSPIFSSQSTLDFDRGVKQRLTLSGTCSNIAVSAADAAEGNGAQQLLHVRGCCACHGGCGG